MLLSCKQGQQWVRSLRCAIRMTVSVRSVMNSKADVSISGGFICLTYAEGLKGRPREACYIYWWAELTGFLEFPSRSLTMLNCRAGDILWTVDLAVTFNHRHLID